MLVTGASGFVGGWAARSLLEGGYRVRALYRRRLPPPHLQRLGREGAELVRGDLTDGLQAREAVRGMEAVVHAAALTGDWGAPQGFRRLNVELTALLLEEARTAGVRVFLYVSSVAVYGFGPHVNTTEEGPYYPLVNPYQATKKTAEGYVIAANAPGFRTTAVRPGNVYGPGDTTMLYRLLDGQRRGVKGTLGGGRTLTCPVYVEDLAAGIVLALEQQASAGEVFNLTGGEWVTWREFLGYAAELLGIRPWLQLPIPAARALAWLLAGAYRLFGIRVDPPITRYRVDQLSHDFHFSIAKAEAVLGYRPRVRWREGLRRAVAAYRADATASVGS